MESLRARLESCRHNGLTPRQSAEQAGVLSVEADGRGDLCLVGRVHDAMDQLQVRVAQDVRGHLRRTLIDDDDLLAEAPDLRQHCR